MLPWQQIVHAAAIMHAAVNTHASFISFIGKIFSLLQNKWQNVTVSAKTVLIGTFSNMRKTDLKYILKLL